MLRTSGVMSLKTRRKSSTVLQGRHLGSGGISPLSFIEENFLEKVIQKEHFGVILRILLVKQKHLSPPLRRQKMSIAAIEKRRFYILRVLKHYVKKVEILKCGHGRREPRGHWGRHFSKKFTFHLPHKNFLTTFLETKIDSSAKFTGKL